MHVYGNIKGAPLSLSVVRVLTEAACVLQSHYVSYYVTDLWRPAWVISGNGFICSAATADLISASESDDS